jgi:hypothetical protein
MAQPLGERSDVARQPIRLGLALESMQFCGVRYAANATASLPFAGRKPG